MRETGSRNQLMLGKRGVEFVCQNAVEHLVCFCESIFEVSLLSYASSAVGLNLGVSIKISSEC